MSVDNSQAKIPFRIGHGFDVHAFTEGDHIVLAGIRIKHTHGLLAHSDGDVVIHAICDALLGSIAAGDIGRHFPDSDPKYKNIDSGLLLENVYQKVKQEGYILSNLDVTIVAQAPTLSPYMMSMCESIAAILEVKKNQINIKATTTEKLGFTGRKEGIAVHAVALVSVQ
ncbi:MAG: 2-C-methyl-D-erythritol 2,4-cyclodiphosphate synthase [Gammaproteobacteria bacterium]|nr:2-C-methyl-D-erythritol 2,4-cyclodiphosphate synthase [Gammaproteobacteria bacterium]